MVPVLPRMARAAVRAASLRVSCVQYVRMTCPMVPLAARAFVTAADDAPSKLRRTRKAADSQPAEAKRTSNKTAPLQVRRSRRSLASLYTDAPLYSYTPPILPDDAVYCHPHLPHPTQWKNTFSFTKEQHARHRYFVSNRDTARDIVAAIGLDDPARPKATIIEAYAGPGTLTRELMLHRNVERVVSLEDVASFVPWLHKLYDDPALSEVRDKLRVLPESGFAWDTYETLVRDGYLDHLIGRLPNLGDGAPPMDWHVTSPLVFVAQLPNTVYGEQLFAQLVHAICSGFWLFKYGRVKMVFVCGESVAARALAVPNEARNRAKLGTTVQCLSTPRLLIPTENMQPYGDHFYPPNAPIGPRVPITATFIPNSNISSGLQKRNLCTLEIDPLPELLVEARDLDSFEFLTRNLFVLKTKPIAEALKHVAPGATNVLKLLAPDHPRMRDRPQDVVLPDTLVMSLTNHQWAALAVAFEKWPFRPQNLFEEGRLQRGKNADNQFF